MDIWERGESTSRWIRIESQINTKLRDACTGKKQGPHPNLFDADHKLNHSHINQKTSKTNEDEWNGCWDEWCELRMHPIWLRLHCTRIQNAYNCANRETINMYWYYIVKSIQWKRFTLWIECICIRVIDVCSIFLTLAFHSLNAFACKRIVWEDECTIINNNKKQHPQHSHSSVSEMIEHILRKCSAITQFRQFWYTDTYGSGDAIYRWVDVRDHQPNKNTHAHRQCVHFRKLFGFDTLYHMF